MVIEKNMDYMAIRKLIAKAHKAGDKTGNLYLMASAQRVYDKLEELTLIGYTRFIIRIENRGHYEGISLRGVIE